MVANGLVFGLWRGMAISLTGGMVGALAAYAIGRFAGRAVIARLLPASTLAAADQMSRKYGPWAVLLERWVPGVPCDPVSYAAGLTRMPALLFTALTLAGLIPANLVTAYVGSEMPGDIPMRYWFSGVAVVAAGWVVWRAVRGRRAHASGANQKSM
jgi:uncharacterized membrane protein YdjX (TVP38/TMEM64 family)